MIGEPPSASVAVAVQVSVEVTLTPVVGVIAALEMTGSVLPTLTLALAESVAPEPSVAVAVQAMVSDGDAVELVNVRLELVPRVLVPLVHSYVIVGVSPSASVAVAEQLKVELVVTLLLGETVGPEITGAVFETVMLSLPVGPVPPSASVGVTTTSQESPAAVALDGSVAAVWLLDKTPPLYQA
jgi:hypothetical protein